MSNPTFRQAVLLIHGIGEQRPMSTLRSFVAALVGDGFRSKPDDLSKSFELRRLIYEVKGCDGETYQTCFFECYWAFRLRDTNYRNIIEWGRSLLKTSWQDVPPRLKRIWTLCWITIGLVALVGLLVGLVYLGSKTGTLPPGLEALSGWAPLISMIAALSSLLTSGFLLYRIGDAARYLDAVPANIVERQAIRADGIELLRELHDAKDGDKPKYARIIVLGHSLGSVIGYDILKFHWTDVNEHLLIAFGSEAASKLKDLDQIAEGLSRNGKAVGKSIPLRTSEDYQKAQGALMDALPPNKQWRITDFITLGSPLTYADFLIATSRCDLALQKKQRETPTCPPEEDEKTHQCWFEAKDEKGQIIGQKLHHAAHFALTKWTNIYFAEDSIGGPLGPLFGSGVRDIKCDYQPHGWLFRRLRSHTHYWDTSSTSLKHLKAIVSWPDPHSWDATLRFDSPILTRTPMLTKFAGSREGLLF